MLLPGEHRCRMSPSVQVVVRTEDPRLLTVCRTAVLRVGAEADCTTNPANDWRLQLDQVAAVRAFNPAHTQQLQHADVFAAVGVSALSTPQHSHTACARPRPSAEAAACQHNETPMLDRNERQSVFMQNGPCALL